MQNSPARAAVDVGTVIAGTYTIEALLGRGGMGAVFLASHNRLPGKKVAIKILHAEVGGDEVLARFKREAQIASMLGHPNIVHVEDFDVMPDGTPYLVLEYLQGETLAQRIAAGPIALEQLLSIVRQIGSALAAAHKAGVVHRDLKPQNIFLVPTELDGHAFEQVKVLDFGISKMRGSQTVKTQDTALLGTPQYMAPEQATGRHAEVDERTDIFALGVIVYEMLAGHPAFDGASIPEVVFKVVYEQPKPLANVPPQIASAVTQAMAKPQAERFATMNTFVEALTGQPLPPPRAPGTTSVPPTSAPTPSRGKSTGNEAFDKTIGSGDHAEAVRNTPLPPPEQPVRGSAPTVSTGSGTVVPAPRSRRGLIVGVLAGVVVVGGVATYLATRGGDAPAPPPAKPPRPVEVAQAPHPPHPAPPPPAPVEHHVAPAPAPTPPPPAKPAPAPPSPTKPAPTPATKPAADAPSQDQAAGIEHLAQAEAALVRKDWATAKELASSVINNEAMTPRERNEAYAIQAIVGCHMTNDQATAYDVLRRLQHNPVLRHRVLVACHDAGVPLQP